MYVWVDVARLILTTFDDRSRVWNEITDTWQCLQYRHTDGTHRHCIIIIRRRRSKVNSLIFVLFVLHSVFFHSLGIEYQGKNNNNKFKKIIIISRLITFFSQLPLNHWVQSMRRVTFSCLNSVASLLISRATTEKSAFYFSDSPFWFRGTMPSYCMTVLWRRRRSKVNSFQLDFCTFLYCIA